MTGPVTRLLTTLAVESHDVIAKRSTIVTSVALRLASWKQLRRNVSHPGSGAGSLFSIGLAAGVWAHLEPPRLSRRLNTSSQSSAW
jgi:hypothetical protein